MEKATGVKYGDPVHGQAQHGRTQPSLGPIRASAGPAGLFEQATTNHQPLPRPLYSSHLSQHEKEETGLIGYHSENTEPR